MSISSPIDLQFSRAKDVKNQATNLTLQAEHGGRVDFAALKANVDSVLAQLDLIAMGRTPQSTDGVSQGSQVGLPMPQNISSYSSLRPSSVRVTELQKRRAEGLATELRQMTDYLFRCHSRNEAKHQLELQQQKLLGGTTARERTDYSVLDMQQREQESLRHINRQFVNMQAESTEILQALQKQGGRLKNSSYNLNSLVASLGLSNTMIGQIARRNKADAIIVFVGIFLLLVLMYVIWNRH